MSNVVFWPDVSAWQARVNDQFAGPFLMYKISEGATYLDPNAAHNGAWCQANSGPGRKLVGHGGYHVWAPGNEQAQADLFFSHAKLSPRFVAMIDVESWQGRISGDHSASITKLVYLFVQRLGQRRVKVYANSGDLAELYPTRPPRLGLVKAKYSSFAPAEPWSGWQYTDGSTNNPRPTSYPRASAPFGNCDHNAYLGTLAEFADEWGITPPVPVKPTPIPGSAPAVKHPISLEESMKTLHRVHDAKFPDTTLPKGVTWPGIFLQGSDLKLHHVETSADHASYLKLGIPEQPMTYPEFLSYKHQGLVYA